MPSVSTLWRACGNISYVKQWTRPLFPTPMTTWSPRCCGHWPWHHALDNFTLYVIAIRALSSSSTMVILMQTHGSLTVEAKSKSEVVCPKTLVMGTPVNLSYGRSQINVSWEHRWLWLIVGNKTWRIKYLQFYSCGSTLGCAMLLHFPAYIKTGLIAFPFSFLLWKDWRSNSQIVTAVNRGDSWPAGLVKSGEQLNSSGSQQIPVWKRP